VILAHLAWLDIKAPLPQFVMQFGVDQVDLP
jgi:hypothetical protein